jgi:hypothetical protein
MTVTQYFTVAHPNGCDVPVWELTREQAQALYNDLSEALGYTGAGQDAKPTVHPTSFAEVAPKSMEELEAEAQVLAKLAAMPVKENTQRGSALGSGQMH